MRITGMMMVAALGMAAMSVPAMAQQAGGYTPTPQQLDQMSKERMQATGPRNWGPPPAQSSIPPQNLHQPSELVVCMSIKQWDPIYGKPSASSAVVGKTLAQVAVKGAAVNGFVPVLMGKGATGYVPASELKPFRSQFKPGLTCNVEIRADGSPVYDLH
jgi:hypothetical protein